MCFRVCNCSNILSIKMREILQRIELECELMWKLHTQIQIWHISPSRVVPLGSIRGQWIPIDLGIGLYWTALDFTWHIGEWTSGNFWHDLTKDMDCPECLVWYLNGSWAWVWVYQLTCAGHGRDCWTGQLIQFSTAVFPRHNNNNSNSIIAAGGGRWQQKKLWWLLR